MSFRLFAKLQPDRYLQAETATDVGRTASLMLSQALPRVFDRFGEAAVRVKKSDLEALMTTEKLLGLPPIFSSLNLVCDQGGKPVFDVDRGPLAEVMSLIENRTGYGENASGRYLTDSFAKEPFGWEFDGVRLFIVSLLRAGKIEATSKGQVIESALSLEAKNTFSNNNLFRQASFRPKTGVEFTHLLTATDAFKNVFGHEISEIEQSVVANAIRNEVSKHEEDIHEVHKILIEHGMPGADVLQDAIDQMRVIRNGNEENAILTFNTSFSELKEGLKRSSELRTSLTEPCIRDFDRGRKALEKLWPFLEQEADIDEECRACAEQLTDMMDRETFFRELPAIDQHARSLEAEYNRRYEEALESRASAYSEAIQRLGTIPEWEQLDKDQQQRISEPFSGWAARDMNSPVPIPLLRADAEACPARFSKAIEDMMVMLDGQRVVQVRASKFCMGGIETQDQLDASLEGLREECERLLGSGKKILLL